jgi:hypothetical protein
MAKMLFQTPLPHRAQPEKQYIRTNGNVTPRLILVWITIEALRTGETKAGAWTFAVELQGTARLAVHWRSLGNDPAV